MLILNIKKKRAHTKPRRRGEEESETTSERLARKDIVDIKHKQKRTDSKPRRRGEEESETTSEHLGRKDIVDVKHKQKRTDSKPRRRREEESETTSERLARRDIVDIKHKEKRAHTKPRRRGEEESETTSERLARKDIVDIKHKEKRTHIKPRRRGEESEPSELSNISRRAIIDIKKGKQGYTKGQKYYNKNIIITPSGYGDKKIYDSQYGRREFSTGDRNLNIGTIRGRDFAGYDKSGIRNISSDKGRYGHYGKYGQFGQYGQYGQFGQYDQFGQTLDILNQGLQYFTKNIVIEPVLTTTKGGQNNIYTYENINLAKSGKSISSGKQMKDGRIKKAWEVEGKYGEEIYSRRTPSDHEILTESEMRRLGINENTKLYHKEITIRPVVIPKQKSKN